MAWYSKNTLSRNIDTLIKTIVSSKDPLKKIVDKPFIKQYHQTHMIDCTAWNYVWNRLIAYACHHPLDIFIKSHAFQFRKSMPTNVPDFINLTYKKFLLDDDINRNDINYYVTVPASVLHIKFAKYSLPFMQTHMYDLAKWLLSNKVSKYIQLFYNENLAGNSNNQGFLDKRNNYIYNYLMEFAIYNPRKLFNKRGLFKLNHNKRTFSDAFDTAYWDFTDGHYDKSLINKYVVSHPKKSNCKSKIKKKSKFAKHSIPKSITNINTSKRTHFSNIENGIGVNQALRAITVLRSYLLKHPHDFSAHTAEMALRNILQRCNAHLYYVLLKYYQYNITSYDPSRKALPSYNSMINVLSKHSAKIIKDTYKANEDNKKVNLTLTRAPMAY